MKDERLAACQPFARLLYRDMHSLADKEGRLEDRPRWIAGEVFPYDDCDVTPLLDELHRHGFIQRYAVNGKRCICLPEFKHFQKPHQREQPSKLPEPPSRFAEGDPKVNPGPTEGDRYRSGVDCDPGSIPGSEFDPKTGAVYPRTNPQSGHERADRLKQACRQAIQIDSPNNPLEHLTEVVRQQLGRSKDTGPKFTKAEITSMLEFVVNEYRDAASA
jgi:hypothetical protein